MSKHFLLFGCATAMLFCVGQSLAQQPVSTPLSLHGGSQAYRPVRPWRGLNLAAFFGGTYNTATGVQALNSCAGCYGNVADGYQALYAYTDCEFNIANGYLALYGCTTCSDNVANGSYALQLCTTCYYNLADGYEALQSCTTCWGNTGVGWSALSDVSTGTGNTAVGQNSLENLTTGVGNTAIGVGTEAATTTSSYNTAVGYSALIYTTGSDNTATGAYALYNGTTGSDNTVMGYQALYENTTGNFNTVSGLLSMYANTTGSFNVASGLGALQNNTTGGGNTAIGMGALASNTTGSDNTTLGFAASVGSGALTNAMALGYEATVSSSNQVVVGSTTVTSIGGYENWTKFSDGRYKKNIQANVPGLAFINKLNPVTYTLDVSGIEAQLHKNEPSLPAVAAVAQKSPTDDPVMKQAMQEKSAIVSTGFIAQDVEKAADSVGFTFSGVDKPKSSDQSFYGLRYGDFVPPLVKAVQELSASSDKKDSVINALQSKFDSLQTQVNELRALLAAQKGSASGASLDQNVPNPFTGSTSIGYSLPKGVSTAQMRITDMTGKVLAVIPLSGSGKNTLKADVAGYAAGTYTYSLIVNGQLVSTKQMTSIH
jgi:trimeric autotransporter adhesin